MKPYGKIATAWRRDTERKTPIEGRWASEELAVLAGLEWEWTEKIDGTNIRVCWDGEDVGFHGRTDAASIPGSLVAHLSARYRRGAFERSNLPPLVIYGEGYGAGIESGGNYIPDGAGFVAFDVRCGGLWLSRANITDVCAKIGAPIVPIVGVGKLADAISAVRAGLPSVVADGRCLAEGIVARPPCGLFDRRGRRIIAKIKTKDFEVCAPRIQRKAAEGDASTARRGEQTSQRAG